MGKQDDALPMARKETRGQSIHDLEENVSSPLLQLDNDDALPMDYEVITKNTNDHGSDDNLDLVDSGYVAPDLVGIGIAHDEEDPLDLDGDDMIYDEEFNPLTPGGQHKRIISGFH